MWALAKLCKRQSRVLLQEGTRAENSSVPDTTEIWRNIPRQEESDEDH